MKREQFIQDIETLLELEPHLSYNHASLLLALVKSDTTFLNKIYERTAMGKKGSVTGFLAKGYSLNDRVTAIYGWAQMALGFRPWEK